MLQTCKRNNSDFSIDRQLTIPFFDGQEEDLGQGGKYIVGCQYYSKTQLWLSLSLSEILPWGNIEFVIDSSNFH